MDTNVVNKKVSLYGDGYMYKQHLRNIWNSIHEKVKQHWGWVEKKELLIKKACSIKLVRSNSNVLNE